MQNPHAADSHLPKIFESLKSLLLPYSQLLEVRADTDSKYELWSNKPVVINGKNRKDLFFASIIRQKEYVGFYFMPVYVDKEIIALFPQDLLKLLQGKSCFHIREDNKVIYKQITTALKTGYKLYKQRGWV